MPVTSSHDCRRGLPTPAPHCVGLGGYRFGPTVAGADGNYDRGPEWQRMDRWQRHATGTAILAPFGADGPVPPGPKQGMNGLRGTYATVEARRLDVALIKGTRRFRGGRTLEPSGSGH